MPIYLYENPKTKEVKEVLQGMNDVHEYSENGVKWNRIFTKPTASIDTQLNPNSAADFVNSTKNKNYSIGDLWDKSAELSEKRGGKEDKLKQKALDDYKKKTGKHHPSENKTGVIEI